MTSSALKSPPICPGRYSDRPFALQHILIRDDMPCHELPSSDLVAGLGIERPHFRYAFALVLFLFFFFLFSLFRHVMAYILVQDVPVNLRATSSIQRASSVESLINEETSGFPQIQLSTHSKRAGFPSSSRCANSTRYICLDDPWFLREQVPLRVDNKSSTYRSLRQTKVRDKLQEV